MNQIITVKSSIAIIAVLTAALLIVPAFAFDEHEGNKGSNHHAHDGKHALPPFLRNVSLTTEQKEKIDSILKSEKPTMQTARNLRHTLINDLHNIDKQANIKSVEEIATKLGELEKQTWINRSKVHQQIVALLNPEQQKIIEENMAKHTERVEKNVNEL